MLLNDYLREEYAQERGTEIKVCEGRRVKEKKTEDLCLMETLHAVQ